MTDKRRVYTDEQIFKMRELREMGATLVDIAKRFKCDYRVIMYWTDKEFRSRRLKYYIKWVSKKRKTDSAWNDKLNTYAREYHKKRRKEGARKK